MASGRSNPRHSGGLGLDVRTALGFLTLGVIIASIASIQLGIWADHTMASGPAPAPNPFMTAGQLLGGNRPWSVVATTVVITVWALILLLTTLVWWIVRRWRTPQTRVDSAARFLADSSDVASLSREAAETAARSWLPNPDLAHTHPGLRFGKVPGTKTGLYSTWEDLYLIIFGPRMGKTTSQVIPAIVDAPGNVITTSNKRDIVDDTFAVTSGRGQVWVFDPQRIAAGFTQEPWFFDPLDMIRRDPDMMDSAALRLADIFKTAARGNDTGGDVYFSDGGRDLLSRFLLAAALDNRPIGDVYVWVNDDSDRTPVRILNTHPEWSQQATALAATYTITEKTRSGLFSQAAQMATALGRRETLRWITPTPGGRRFEADDFVRGQQDTVYILSKEGADNAAALTTALTAAITTAAERYGEECGGRLPVPLIAALDEAANVVKWPELPALYSHYGSRGIILMTILQSYTQGVGVWGEEGMEAMWSAASILLYGGGVRDDKMLQKLESLIGEVEIFETSTSRTGDGPRSVSTQRREKKILTVAELASLQQWRALVLASKRRPLVAELEPYWVRRWPETIRTQLGVTA